MKPHELETIRTKILEQAAKKRSQVGLNLETDLSVLQAAALYDRAVARQLLEQGVECDLHSACVLGDREQIARLADAKPTALEECVDHLPPLGFAILTQQLESVEALLAAGDSPNRPIARCGWFVWETEAIESDAASWTPLQQAALHSYSAVSHEIARRLLEARADTDAFCVLGEQAIHLAATTGPTPVIQTLVEHGASVDSRSRPTSDSVWRMSTSPQHARAHGLTPLMVATREGHTETVDCLLDLGGSLDAVDSNGWTPLHYAARPWNGENTRIVEALLTRGAKRSVTNSDGETPAQLAQTAGYEESARWMSAPCR